MKIKKQWMNDWSLFIGFTKCFYQMTLVSIFNLLSVKIMFIQCISHLFEILRTKTREVSMSLFWKRKYLSLPKMFHQNKMRSSKVRVLTEINTVKIETVSSIKYDILSEG